MADAIPIISALLSAANRGVGGFCSLAALSDCDGGCILCDTAKR